MEFDHQISFFAYQTLIVYLLNQIQYSSILYSAVHVFMY